MKASLFMKKLLIYTLLALFAGGCFSSFYDKNESNSFRYVAYLKSNRSVSYFNFVKRSGVTHLNLWFFNPDSQGEWYSGASDKELFSTLKRAKRAKIKVFASLGGGILTKNQKKEWGKISTSQGRDFLVDSIVRFCQKYGFDGIDLDLEGRSIPVGYSEFILLLDQALDLIEIELSAAVSSHVTGMKINDSALKRLDFINVMSYNFTGSWSKVPGDHSSYEDTKREVSYWVEKRGMIPSKVVIGVPFYARVWEEDETKNRKATYIFSIRSLASYYPDELHDIDFIEEKHEGWGTRFVSLNSRKTLRKKLDLAYEVGGIMCWTLEYDDLDPYFSFSQIIKNYSKERRD